MKTQTRAPKQLGDFGEGLVTYALIRKKFEVAYVDHVGADLIAEKNKNRFAVSVKTRLFRENSTESLVFVVDEQHLKKLEHFAIQFGNMIPLFALVVCIASENTIHLIISRTDEIRKNLPKVKFGYSLRFTRTMRKEFINMPFIDYSCWANEKLGDKDFTPQDAEDGVFEAAPKE